MRIIRNCGFNTRAEPGCGVVATYEKLGSVADYQQVFWCPNVTAAIIDAGITLADETIYLGYDFEVTFGTWKGFPATILEAGDPPNQTRYIYVFNGVAVGDYIPARAALMTPGFTMQLHYEYGPTYVIPSWTDVFGPWQDVIIPFLSAAIDYYTNGVTGEVTYQYIGSAAGFFEHMVAIVPIFTDAEVLIWQTSIYGALGGTGDSYATTVGIQLPYPVAPVGNLNVSGLDRITKALEDIAAQDFEIGLNNGASIFRVKGKSTITGPGGGGGE